MDVVIPSHHVKLFNSSIISLSKIGKDLYLEFDSLKGLSLRTLNDGKSAYCHVHYEPTFFERCTVPSGNTTRTTTSRKRTLQENNDDDDDDSASSQQTTNYYSCRIPLRALQPVVRPRKRVQSLRVTAPDQDAVALQFEFTLPHADTLLTVLHTIQVAANCQGVSACTATDIPASEIVASPIILSRLLEPLQRTAEAALIVRAHDAQDSTVSASSFHPEMAHPASENGANSNGTNNNAIFQGNQAALLKSETAVAVDEFLEFDFVANRDILDDLPEECNREVILVFSLKECRAALQFLCSLEETMATLTFHWGGMPVTLSADQQSWSMTLVLATLDYKLLTSLRTPAAAH